MKDMEDTKGWEDSLCAGSGKINIKSLQEKESGCCGETPTPHVNCSVTYMSGSKNNLSAQHLIHGLGKHMYCEMLFSL